VLVSDRGGRGKVGVVDICGASHIQKK
jgi:hypothetical protein